MPMTPWVVNYDAKQMLGIRKLVRIKKLKYILQKGTNSTALR